MVMEASAARATFAIALMTTKAGTDFFTVMFVPEMLAAIALRSRYIQPYITGYFEKCKVPMGS
jgi:hypothetical protein